MQTKTDQHRVAISSHY